jgi:hypothetical protein
LAANSIKGTGIAAKMIGLFLRWNILCARHIDSSLIILLWLGLPIILLNGGLTKILIIIVEGIG